MAYAGGTDLTGNVEIKLLVPLYSLGLFTCCMVCHGELAMTEAASALPDALLPDDFRRRGAGWNPGRRWRRRGVFSGFYEMPLALVAAPRSL